MMMIIMIIIIMIIIIIIDRNEVSNRITNLFIDVTTMKKYINTLIQLIIKTDTKK